MKRNTMGMVWLMALLLMLAGLVAPIGVARADSSDPTATGGCVEMTDPTPLEADDPNDQAAVDAVAGQTMERDTKVCGKTAPNATATPPEHGWSEPDGFGGDGYVLGCNWGEGGLVVYDLSFGAGSATFSGLIQTGGGNSRAIHSGRGIACGSPWGCTLVDRMARRPGRMWLLHNVGFYWAADAVSGTCI